MNKAFISKIILRNFKCYKHLELPLQAGVNILYGTNGTGKTSILEGINIAAGAFFIKLSGVEKREIELSDIRLATLDAMPYPEYQFPVEIEAEGCVFGNDIIWSRSLNTIAGGITSINAKEIQEQSDYAAQNIQNGEKKVLPIIAYFSTQRLFTHRKELRADAQKQSLGRLSGYFNALNATNTRKHIQSWFKDAEYEQYQKRQSDPSFTNIGLESIKSLILNYFNEWERIYYYEPESHSRLEKGLYIVHKNKNIIPESLLSDGYRNFLWLIIEVAWRCYILNPFLGKEVFHETTGIVTIDEIDLHLHPKWQQMIVPVLASAFPNIQFVITTHSPIILGSTKSHVLKLNGDTGEVQGNLYGFMPSHILEIFMQTQERLPELQADINQYFRLINEEKGRGAEAIALRTKLAANISQDDPLFTKADALIDFLSY